MKLVPDKTLLRIWKALPPQLGSAVGEEAKLSGPELAREWAPTGKRYYAELELVEPHSAKLWMSFALPLAIASAGHLMMRPKNAIRSSIESGTFDGDDPDAMGECVNSLCAALNEAVRAELGDNHRIVFRTGSLDPPAVVGIDPLWVASGRLEFGDLAAGELELVVPERVFVVAREGADDEDDDDDDEEDDEDDEDDDDGAIVDDSANARGAERGRPRESKGKTSRRRGSGADPDGAAGPLLTAEELAAIREATSAIAKGLALIVADREASRELWRESLASTGAEFELVANYHQVLAMCRARNVEVVVVDADASASGGLSLLAAIRGGVGVPARRVVVASSATHSHLVACFAGGATDYVVRPLDDEMLGRVLNPA